MSSKYQPLADYLLSLESQTREISLSFSELEKILGSTLPKSAIDHRPWWGNQRDSKNRPQAAAWMSSGFEVEDVDQRKPGGRVLFRRVG